MIQKQILNKNFHTYTAAQIKLDWADLFLLFFLGSTNISSCLLSCSLSESNVIFYSVFSLTHVV